jgi:phage/plasmid-associated DNA primase
MSEQVSEGVDEAFVSAKAALASGIAGRENVAAEFASLNRTIDERKKRIDAALSGARTNAAQAATAVETAQGLRSVLC